MQDRLLIDGSNHQLVLAAFLEAGQLYDFYCDIQDDSSNFGNIYYGRVTNVVQSLSAYFVDYGGNKNGFLPFTSCLIDLKRGDMVLVQIQKSEKDAKGARLSCFIKLIGQHYIFMPYNSSPQQYQVRKAGLQVQKNKYGIVDQKIAEDDLKSLKKEWDIILEKTQNLKELKLLKKESSLLERVLRDKYLHRSIEILVDGHGAYKNILEIVTRLNLPHTVQEYNHLIPIFDRYSVSSDILNLSSRTVPLLSGGSISIDISEAMVCIDINSSSCNIGKLEETSYKVNLEAAEEVVRQVRMRDLSGIIAIDFIDLKNATNLHNLEKRVHELFKKDLSLVRIAKINEFGVMMISRQRAGISLHDLSHIRCTSCNHLTEPRVESLAFNLFSELRLAIYSNPYENIQVKCSSKLAYYVLNYMRSQLVSLEKDNIGQIIVSESSELDLRADQKSYFSILPKGSLKKSDLIEIQEPVSSYNLYDSHYLVFYNPYDSFTHLGQTCVMQN